MQCEALKEENRSFISKINIAMCKVVKTAQQKKVIKSIENDLVEFLTNDTKEISTNQRWLGCKQVFRGYVVHFLSNNCQDKVFNHNVNKIMVNMCTNHYIE